MNFEWNYEEGCADMEMPVYVTNALNRLQHTQKLSPLYYPHHNTGFQYSTTGIRQYAQHRMKHQYFPKNRLFRAIYSGINFVFFRFLDGTIFPYLKKSFFNNTNLHNIQNKMSIINGISSYIS